MTPMADLFAFAFETTRPLDPRQNPPRGEQHRRDHQLLDAVGVGTGRVEHDDAALRALVDGNVVHTGAGSRDGLQRGGQVQRVHVRTAKQDAVGIL
jgi:hypothetical protein